MHRFLTAVAFTLLTGTLAPGASAQFPSAVLDSASIVSPNRVDVAVAPAAVTMHIAAHSPTFITSVSFSFVSPSGNQTIAGRQDFTANPNSVDTTVQTVFGGGGLGQHGLNLYSEAGVWTLHSIAICSNPQSCTTIAGSALAAAVPQRSILVTNRGTPVSALPRVTAASIVNPTVQLTNPFPGIFQLQPLQISVSAADAGPGIVAVQATFTTPTTYFRRPFQSKLIATAPTLGAPQTSTTANLATGQAAYSTTAGLTGIYALSRLEIADEAGNVLDVTDAKALAALFPSGTTVTVTAP